MIETFVLVVVITITFAGGVLFGYDLGRSERRKKSTENFKPVGEFNDQWIGEPPPFYIGSTVAEKPPTVIHMHQWRRHDN